MPFNRSFWESADHLEKYFLLNFPDHAFFSPLPVTLLPQKFLLVLSCCCCSVAKSCLTHCDSTDWVFPVYVTPWTECSLSTISQSLLKLTSINFGDAIQPPHFLLTPSSPALNLSQHQGLFQWVGSSHQVTKVLERQLQHQSFQRKVEYWSMVWSPCSSRDSQESSPAPFSSFNSLVLSLLYGPTLSYLYLMENLKT